ncbi:MAG TPA: ATP-binding protein, partial [Pyrinomonadaceae bacterium]
AVFVELFKKTEEIKQQAELLHEKNIELENANLQRLGKLIELGQRLAAERNPERVLEKFCHAARAIVGAKHAGVGVLADDGESLRYFYRSDSQETRNGHQATPRASDAVLKALLAERHPLRLSEVESTLEEVHLSAHEGGAQSFLGAPILSSAHVYGWVYLTDKLDADEFNEADERLAVTLATQVAVAYENAQLYTEAQQHAAALQQEVAERKQAEEERAALLIREQEARAEAEQANRTKDEFLATLSHELRTPLTAILGWTHLIRSGKLDEANLTRALETIERNARSQSQLIDDLLDVSRIITGKLKLEFRPVELGSIIEAAIDTVRPMAEAKTIRLEPALETTHCLVSGDPSRLQQVVWNLFSNAVKFTPDGGRIDINLKCNETHIELSVRDSGIGISPDFLPYIFDRFRQADGTTTRKHGGLGLGLAIVRHLIELHGGSIKARSDGEGLGSEFTVRLPLKFAASGNTGRAAEAARAAPGQTPAAPDGLSMLKGLRILVVDDELDTREVLKGMLVQHGAEVRVSESTAEALDILQLWNPDLLVSDIGMPEEDGYSLIKKVRTLDSSRHGQIPAIALTAYATFEDRVRAEAAGFHMHLAKPVEPEELVNAIAGLAGRREQI